MNSRFLDSFVVFAIICVATPTFTSRAQEKTPPDIPPPKFPLKLRAPENATWTITAKGNDQESADKTPAQLVKVLTVTKTGLIYLENAEVQNGSNWEKWTFLTKPNIYRLIKTAGSSKWNRIYDSRLETSARYQDSDFADFEWLSSSNYKGVEVVKDQPVYVFQAEGQTPLTPEDRVAYDWGAAYTASAEGKSYGRVYIYKAWLDTKTLLPIMLDDGKRVRTFAFGSPGGRLSPPPDVIAELRKWIADDKRKSR